MFIQFSKSLCRTGTLGSYLVYHIISNFSAQESFLMSGLQQLYEGYPFHTENVLFLKAYFCCTEASTKMSVKSCGMVISHIKSCLKFYRSVWLTNSADSSRGLCRGTSLPCSQESHLQPWCVALLRSHRDTPGEPQQSPDWNQLKKKEFTSSTRFSTNSNQQCVHQKA